MKAYSVIFIYLIFSIYSNSSASENVTIYYKNLTTTPKRLVEPFDKFLTMEMLKGLDQLDNMENMFTILQIEDEQIAVANGFLDVFLWKNGTWKNLYTGKFGGNNFGSYKFIYKKELYAFGGYGYWEYNNLLIKFNRQVGTWEFVTKLNTKDDLIGPLCSLEDNQFIVRGGLIENDNKLVPNQYNFTIDLNSKTCTKATSEYTALFEVLNINYQTNYSLNGLLVTYSEERNNYYSLIYNKEDKQYYKNSLKAPIAHKTPLALNDGKIIFIYDTDSTAKKINKTDLLKGAIPIGIRSSNTQTASMSHYTYYFAFLFVIIIGGVWYQFHKKKKEPRGLETIGETDMLMNEAMARKEEIDGKEKIMKYLGVLTVVENTVITPSRLDALLEIDQLDIDSQRARRSQLIKIINEHTTENIGFDFIHRIRDEKDKRYVNYQIGKPKEK